MRMRLKAGESRRCRLVSDGLSHRVIQVVMGAKASIHGTSCRRRSASTPLSKWPRAWMEGLRPVGVKSGLQGRVPSVSWPFPLSWSRPVSWPGLARPPTTWRQPRCHEGRLAAVASHAISHLFGSLEPAQANWASVVCCLQVVDGRAKPGHDTGVDRGHYNGGAWGHDQGGDWTAPTPNLTHRRSAPAMTKDGLALAMTEDGHADA
jgi:hypothetical protein